ncbi:MAG: lipopolysaccharide biosynthesis protein [Novosphingobium sp.]
MNAAAQDRPVSQSVFRSIIQNTAWLLGGKGFGGALSIVYLAILSRSLGLKDFGHFSLIFGTAQALVAIAGFQTWQAVVRYGAAYVHDGDWVRFSRLSMLCGMIDALAAMLGCLIAVVIFFGFAGPLNLNPEYIGMGCAFNCALMWGRVSAPTGMLRALNRFDLAVYVEALVPTGRLIAAVTIWVLGPSVGWFLLAWAVIDVSCAVAYWGIALKLNPRGFDVTGIRQWRQTIRENPGIERFLLIVSSGSTLDAVYKQGPLLAVGYFLGTSAAGLYRLADQVAQGFSKVSTLLARAIYPEISRARVATTNSGFRRMVRRISMVASIAGGIVVVAALLGGQQLLALIGGVDFERGAVILVPLAVASSFELASVAFEPVLHSSGVARYALFGKIVTVTVLSGAILVFKSMGEIGIAWSVATAGSAGYVALGIMALMTLHRLEDPHEAVSSSDAGEASSTDD